MNYIFYDLETSGLSVAFDQVLQYAAITTDENLTIIDEQSNYAQYRSDVLPAPEAAITHCIAQIPKHCPTETETIIKLHKMLNSPNTISLGYNTLGFDDEFLRFAFYRNLLPPYTHQYANGCQRRDIFPMLVLYYLFANSAIDWPIKNDKVSLKLENINSANNLATGAAHDAKVDVYATIALAQKLKSANPEMWNFANKQFDKQYDAGRITSLQKSADFAGYKLALLICPRFGVKRNFMRPAIMLGQHLHYRNQTVWLCLDNPDLCQAKTDNFKDHCHIINRKPGEMVFILPFDKKYTDKLTSEAAQALNSNKNWINNNSALSEIRQHYLDFKYPRIDNIDAYAALYQVGFASTQDSNLMRGFHSCSLEEKIARRNKLSMPYKELAQRLILLNQAHELSEAQQHELKDYIAHSQQSRIDNHGNTSDNLKQIIKRAQSCTQDLNSDQIKALAFCKQKLLATAT